MQFFQWLAQSSPVWNTYNMLSILQDEFIQYTAFSVHLGNMCSMGSQIHNLDSAGERFAIPINKRSTHSLFTQ